MENILFVSTLPFGATSKDLEAFFSEVGPLRSCFVVADKNDPTKNNGCGFVTFVLADDASKAITILKKKKFMDVRYLKIVFARKKTTDESPEPNPPFAPKDSHQEDSIKIHFKKTVSLTELPKNITQKQLYKKVKKYGTVSGLKFTQEEDNATVDYNTYEEATNAVKHLNDHVFKGVKIQAELIYAKV